MCEYRVTQNRRSHKQATSTRTYASIHMRSRLPDSCSMLRRECGAGGGVIGANSCCGDARVLQTSCSAQSPLFFFAAAPIMCGSSEWRPCQAMRRRSDTALIDTHTSVSGRSAGCGQRLISSVAFAEVIFVTTATLLHCCFTGTTGTSVALSAGGRPVVAAGRLAAC